MAPSRRFSHQALVILSVALVGAASLYARQRPAFRSTIDLVMLNVTVTGPGGRYVADLSADDFQILEDGRPQDVAYFSPANVPLSVSLVLDTSSSMDDEMVLSKQAAMDFIARLRPGDMAEIVSFDSRVEVLQPMTSDRALLEAAIQRMRAGGSTALYNAVYIVLRQLEKVKPQTGDDVRRQVIVVLSDGEDTSSLVTLDHLLDSAKRSQTVIYTVGLGLEEPTKIAFRWRIQPSTTRPGNRRAPVPAETSHGSRRCLHADRERADEPVRGRLFIQQCAGRRCLASNSRARPASEPASAHSCRLLRGNAVDFTYAANQPPEQCPWSSFSFVASRKESPRCFQPSAKIQDIERVYSRPVWSGRRRSDLCRSLAATVLFQRETP